MANLLTLYFAGRFQCRLAIDPDPYDEPYGLRGGTIALPGEPPLDRVIRTSEAGAVLRQYCPSPGVRVRCVSALDSEVFRCLDGAVVSLEPQDTVNGPFFEEWNGIRAVPQGSLLSSVDLRLAVGYRTLLRRRAKMRGIAPCKIADRQKLDDMSDEVASVKDVKEISDRIALLSTIRPQDEEERLVIEARQGLLAMSKDESAYARGQGYECSLDGPAVVSLSSVDRQRTIDTSLPWRASFLFSRFDLDAMSGVLAGSLSLPIMESTA